MSAAFPIFSSSRVQNHTGPYITDVATPGTANTKSGWVELIASAEFDATGFELLLLAYANDEARYIVDIGVGASGSEEVLLPNFPCRGEVDKGARSEVYVPLAIKKGTRIAARVAADSASKACGVALTLLNAGHAAGAVFTGADAIGVDESYSGVPNIQTSTAAAYTKTAWLELTASTQRAYRALLVHNMFRRTTGNGGALLTDIGVGAVGSEQVVVPDLYLYSNSSFWVVISNRLRHVAVPAGSRVSFRVACNSPNTFSYGYVGVFGLY